MKPTQQPGCHHNTGYYCYYYCFIYTFSSQSNWSNLLLFLSAWSFFFLHLYIETNKRKELLGISEKQASRLLDGWAAARSTLSNQLSCAANSQQLEKCHHSRTGKGRLNVPAWKQTFWMRHNCSLKRPSAQLHFIVGNSLLILSSPFGKLGEWAGFSSSPERQEVVDFSGPMSSRVRHL